jgi:glycosyltransferase involved in cell wall biosynthesis
MKLFAPLPLAKDEYVRIGWQGGWSHYEDFVLIQSVLERIMHKFKNVILIICGTPFEGVLKNLPKERIQLETWTSVETYPWKFKGLNIDIGIAPLIESTFNDCKSEIKWEEYSALKIATVASQTGPYARAIDHEKTGLLAKNDDEWVEYLSRLIKDVKYRKKLAKQAHEHVKANYGLESNIGIYDKAYKSLYKPELIIV